MFSQQPFPTVVSDELLRKLWASVHDFFFLTSFKFTGGSCKKVQIQYDSGLFHNYLTILSRVAEKSVISGTTFTSPAKCYKIDRKRIVLGDFDTEALRRLLHDFYREKFPTLDSVLVASKEKGIFSRELVC